MKNQRMNVKIRKKIFGSSAIFLLFILTAASAAAQIVSDKTAKLMVERAKLDAKRSVAYDMGVQVGYGTYQAEVTQTEFPNQNSKVYGPALNLRTKAFAKANDDANSINSVLSVASDKLDIKQFSQYSDGYSHEKDALSVAQGIQLNLETKLGMIDSNLHDAFMLGWAAGYAEINASGGEPRRKYVAAYVGLSNYYGKKMNIYNGAGGTLADLAKGGEPISNLYPKIVNLRQWYQTAVGNIK